MSQLHKNGFDANFKFQGMEKGAFEIAQFQNAQIRNGRLGC